MKRTLNRIVIATVLAIALGAASQSFAEGKINCSIMKEGKTTHQLVSSAAACTDLGGKVVPASPIPKAASPKPVSK